MVAALPHRHNLKNIGELSMTKRALAITTLSTALFFSGALQADQTLQANIDEGKGIIKAYVGDLKGELVKGMKKNGPVDTLSTCKLVAPNLTEAHSQMSGWEVSRTSLKLRNQDNAPDTWEEAVLNEFESRKAAGEDPMKLMKAEMVVEDGRKVFRMMKAIPTAEACTKCHGGSIAESVSAKLDELYPSDKARGYKVGDLRGAFTLKKPM
jgi:cytochrome c553